MGRGVAVANAAVAPRPLFLSTVSPGCVAVTSRRRTTHPGRSPRHDARGGPASRLGGGRNRRRGTTQAALEPLGGPGLPSSMFRHDLYGNMRSLARVRKREEARMMAMLRRAERVTVPGPADTLTLERGEPRVEPRLVPLVEGEPGAQSAEEPQHARGVRRGVRWAEMPWEAIEVPVPRGGVECGPRQGRAYSRSREWASREAFTLGLDLGVAHAIDSHAREFGVRRKADGVAHVCHPHRWNGQAHRDRRMRSWQGNHSLDRSPGRVLETSEYTPARPQPRAWLAVGRRGRSGLRRASSAPARGRRG